MRSNRKIKKLLLALLTVSATLLPVSEVYAAVLIPDLMPPNGSLVIYSMPVPTSGDW